jgi:hypothetical protein
MKELGLGSVKVCWRGRSLAHHLALQRAQKLVRMLAMSMVPQRADASVLLKED